MLWPEALEPIHDTEIGTSLFKRCDKGIASLNISHLQFEIADAVQQIACICQAKT